MVADVALLDVIEELELRDGVLPEAEYIVLGFTGCGSQHVGDVEHDLAEGLPLVQSASKRFGGDAFFG